MQEYNRFKQFATSLLNRSSKLGDMITDLQAVAELAKKGPDTLEGKRVIKSATKFLQLLMIPFSNIYMPLQPNAARFQSLCQATLQSLI